MKRSKLYGALLGDCIGSRYEFNNYKGKDFELDWSKSFFTDDSVMTIAIAEAFLDNQLIASHYQILPYLAKYMQKWGDLYPNESYGTSFSVWLDQDNPVPYNSWGNGSAMRVSAAGWMFEDMETTRRTAMLTSLPTHNHPEGIKGAEATAAAIFLARTGSNKATIKQYIKYHFGYDLDKSCDEIRPSYVFNESCQETVPQAITAFLEGEDFEDVIRTAVSLGGDSDTLACIAGSIAEAFYGIPPKLLMICEEKLSIESPDLLNVLKRFNQVYP